MDSGVGTRLDRPERRPGSTSPRRATTDRSSRRRPITATLRDDGVDVGEQDAVDRRSVLIAATCFRDDGIAGARPRSTRQDERGDEPRTVASAPRPPASSRSATSSSRSARCRIAASSRAAACRREAGRDDHPPLAPLLAVPARRVLGSGPRPGEVSLGQSNLGNDTRAPAISISLPCSSSIVERVGRAVSASSNSPASASARACSAWICGR